MADTTSRASATNSGRAGISSSMVAGNDRLGGAVGRRRFDAVVAREDLGQAGDLETLQDARLRADELEVAVVAAQPLEPTDQHAEAGGVEEVDALEVDHDAVLAFGDQLDEPFTELGGRVDVDL